MRTTTYSWLWIAAGVLIAVLIAQSSTVCALMLIPSFMSIEAGSGVDQSNTLAAGAGAVTAIFAFIGAFLGGYLAALKARQNPQAHGSIVGFATGGMLLGTAIYGNFSVWALLGVVMAILGGWLAGRVVGRKPAAA